MEWLILLLLVPAILVPIVLLCGFAGCSFSHGLVPGPPDAPTVTATPKNVDHITVSWQNTDPGPVVGYRFVRTGGTLPPRDENVDASITTVEDTTGLDPDTVYTYEVSTVTEDGTSNPGTVMANTFRTVLNVDPATTTPQTVAPGNYCFVQRIPAGQLLAGGSKVGIKVSGSPAGNVTINRIYISRARAALGTPGINDWDSDTDITPVRTLPLTLPNDIPIDLEPIDYTLGQAQDLIIAFDFTATSSAGNIRFFPKPGVTLYFKAGVQQASLPTRDSDYITQPDPRLYLVVTIGVP